MNDINLYTAFGLDAGWSSSTLEERLSAQLGATDPHNAELREQIDITRRILDDDARRAAYDRHLADPDAPPVTEDVLRRMAGLGDAGGPGSTGGTGRRRVRAVAVGVGALALIAALVASVVLLTGDDEPPTAQAPHCRDVEFIGAAGSGQREGSGDGEQFGGVGETVHDTYTNLAADLPGDTSVNLRAVEYPALAVPFTTATTEWETYFGSVEDGATAAYDLITRTIGECPESQIVVAGYSQGAMAVRRALLELGPGENIVGGVLIGDGDKMPEDGVSTIPDYGTDDFRGIARLATEEWGISSGASAEPLPAEWEDRILSVCLGSDIVCALGSFDISSVAESLSAHSNYDADDWRDFVLERVTG